MKFNLKQEVLAVEDNYLTKFKVIGIYLEVDDSLSYKLIREDGVSCVKYEKFVFSDKEDYINHIKGSFL